MNNYKLNEMPLTNRDRQVSGSWHKRSCALLMGATALMSVTLLEPARAQAQPSQQRPNIVVIMADDVGIWNVSAYHRGMMGGSTPNIDRIAKEGALFTDYYAQQSCTAGRAAFILGQTPFRTGLLTVGLPAAKEGIQDKDPTIAELLKPYGYATAQIGKNHLGDRNEFLPTVHGFDEMVLADLRGGIAVRLEQFGDCWVLVLDTLLGGRQADCQQTRAERRLPQDKGGPAGRAGLLGVVISKECALFGDAVDVGRASTHHPAMVGADIPDADIVGHDHDDVRLLGDRLCRCHT